MTDERRKFLLELAESVPGLLEIAAEAAVENAREAEEDRFHTVRSAQRSYEILERLARGCRMCGSLRPSGYRWWSEVTIRSSLPISYMSRNGSWQDEREAEICDDCIEGIVEQLREVSLKKELPRLNQWFGRSRERVVYRGGERQAGAEVYWAALPERRDIVKIGSAVISEKRWPASTLEILLVEPGGRSRERALHQRYEKWRLPPEHDALRGVPRDGYTEWFSNEGPIAHYLSVAQADLN